MFSAEHCQFGYSLSSVVIWKYSPSGHGGMGFSHGSLFHAPQPSRLRRAVEALQVVEHRIALEAVHLFDGDDAQAAGDSAGLELGGPVSFSL